MELLHSNPSSETDAFRVDNNCRMLKRLNFGAKALSHTDIKVYNYSLVSTLICFPKMSYEDALAR